MLLDCMTGLQVMEARGVEVAMAVVAAAIPLKQGTHGISRSNSSSGRERGRLIAAVDMLSVALGLLINVAEGADPQQRACIAEIQATPVIHTLCNLLIVRP